MDEWEVWYPKAGATGILFCRSRIEVAETVLVHSAPDVLTVTVRSVDGLMKAKGKDLARTADSPMTRLVCNGQQVKRQEVWPTEHDLGSVVLLQGGEAGILLDWWNASDRSEWRWRVEFYNRLEK